MLESRSDWNAAGSDRARVGPPVLDRRVVGLVVGFGERFIPEGAPPIHGIFMERVEVENVLCLVSKMCGLNRNKFGGTQEREGSYPFLLLLNMVSLTACRGNAASLQAVETPQAFHGCRTDFSVVYDSLPPSRPPCSLEVDKY